MSDLGQEEFKSLEAAVRDRLNTWTSGVEDLHFAVLDYPSTLERTLSQQLLEREMNEAIEGDDPGKLRMDYLFALDKVVNAVLVGGDTVQPKTETVGRVYGDILKYGQPLPKRLTPEEAVELQRHRAVLYVENPDTGLLDTTPELALYQALSMEVMQKTLAFQQAQAEHGPDSIEARLKQQELNFAETDLLVRGQKNRIEEAQARIIQLSTNSSELWQKALLDFEDSLLMDAETTEQFPASRCPPVPDSNWMKIDLDMRSGSTGAVLGMNEKLLRLEAEIFLVPVDRSGWMRRGVLTNVPWTWGIMGRSGKLSDGNGGGDLPYLPQHLVLMRDIKLTVQIPFTSDGSLPAARLPKIGRMAVPLQVRALNGRRIDPAPQPQMRMMGSAKPAPADKTAKVKKAGDLKAMRMAQLMHHRGASRALMAQLSEVQNSRRVFKKAPVAPKIQAMRSVTPKMQLGQFASVKIDAVTAIPPIKTKPVSDAEMTMAIKAVNAAKKTVAKLEQQRRKLQKNPIARALHKRQLDENLRRLRAAKKRLKLAEASLQRLRERRKKHAEEKRRAEIALAKQREAEALRRKQEEDRRRAEEARRRAPSEVAIDVHALEGEEWTGRKVTLSIREASGRTVTVHSNAKGEVRKSLKPGSYSARIVDGLDAEETSDPISFDCAMGAPVSQVLTILPKWKTVELQACEAGSEVLLFGYLLQTLPELPQVVDAADVDTEIPDLVG